MQMRNNNRRSQKKRVSWWSSTILVSCSTFQIYQSITFFSSLYFIIILASCWRLKIYFSRLYIILYDQHWNKCSLLLKMLCIHITAMTLRTGFSQSINHSQISNLPPNHHNCVGAHSVPVIVGNTASGASELWYVLFVLQVVSRYGLYLYNISTRHPCWQASGNIGITYLDNEVLQNSSTKLQEPSNCLMLLCAACLHVEDILSLLSDHAVTGCP